MSTDSNSPTNNKLPSALQLNIKIPAINVRTTHRLVFQEGVLQNVDVDTLLKQKGLDVSCIHYEISNNIAYIVLLNTDMIKQSLQSTCKKIKETNDYIQKIQCKIILVNEKGDPAVNTPVLQNVPYMFNVCPDTFNVLV